MKKKTKFINKTDVPDNIVLKQHEMIDKCTDLQLSMPGFLADFFLYLRNSVSPSTRLAYLNDIEFFLKYLIGHHQDFLKYSSIADISVEDFKRIRARDINYFIGDYCSRYRIDGVIYQNNNSSMARKRSSLSVMFKYLFRDEVFETNIVDGFNPIKLPKRTPESIKKLEIEEITQILKIVESGEGLTAREKVFWNKTKLRDKAILVFFITYGLRVSELQQLDLSSFNYQRNEFTIYRKRGKEAVMPLNNSVAKSLRDYIDNERGETIDDDQPLFLSIQKKRMTVRAIRDLVKKYTALVLGTTRSQGYSPHKLRATAASTLIEYGFSIYDVQNLLDHENVTTTQLYSAHKKNAKSDLINQFEILNDDE